MLLLVSQTDRFVAYCARKEEEIKKVKAQAAKRIATLEKQHKFVFDREKVERYQMEWSHIKEVVSCMSAMAYIQKAKE